MRSDIPFFLTFVLLAGCVTAGCSSLPFFGVQNKEAPVINVGFTSTNFPAGHGIYSFDDVTGRLSAASVDEGNNSPTNTTGEKQILYIRGIHVDEKGAAASWMFAVRDGNRTSLVTYDDRGETMSDVSAGFSGKEILLDQIVTPPQLLERNGAIIFKTQPENRSEVMDLELWGDNYTLTMAGRDRTRILIFDAKTGALTVSND